MGNKYLYKTHRTSQMVIFLFDAQKYPIVSFVSFPIVCSTGFWMNRHGSGLTGVILGLRIGWKYISRHIDWISLDLSVWEFYFVLLFSH